jgi:hypothetical protein
MPPPAENASGNPIRDRQLYARVEPMTEAANTSLKPTQPAETAAVAAETILMPREALHLFRECHTSTVDLGEGVDPNWNDLYESIVDGLGRLLLRMRPARSGDAGSGPAQKVAVQTTYEATPEQAQARIAAVLDSSQRDHVNPSGGSQ